MSTSILAIGYVLTVLIFQTSNGAETRYLSYTAQLGTTPNPDESAGSSPYTFNWSVSTGGDRLRFEVCLMVERGRLPRLFGVGFGPLDAGPVDMDTYLIRFRFNREMPKMQTEFVEGYTDHGGIFHERNTDAGHDGADEVNVYDWSGPHLARQVQLHQDQNGKVCLRFSRKALSCVKKGYSIDVHIPAEDTTYWCKTATLPKFNQKHHIVRGLTFPEETGIAIGGSEESSHVVIEIHYNNPKRIAGKCHARWK
ncbi:unnamed protein product [Echinostoma caproni]|uniref:Cu2_monooxygen domain-containing protein n=1 Tax=Echinostoma caproni TaxID=27848 RepID=A0A183AHQ8_9TREM|nr:unnamed protein product [Echinostoma caproni]